MKKGIYWKGKRRELILLLHYCGAIPYSAINYIEPSQTSRMYHALINKMRKEELVDVSTLNEERQLVFKDYGNVAPLFTKVIPSVYQDYYLNVGENQKRIALYNCKRESRKVLGVNDLVLFMYSLGVKTLLSDKENLVRCKELPADENMYYTSRELKMGIGSRENREVQRTLVGSRVDGLLISAGGIYPTFNIQDARQWWKPTSEMNMKLAVERLINSKYIYYGDRIKCNCDSILLFSKSSTMFSKILSDDKRYEGFKKMLRSRNLFNNVYALTTDTNGKKMLGLMMKNGWQRQMLEKLLPKDALEVGVYTTVACDGYDKENGVYKLLFCIPNISKLYIFATRAKKENTPEKFEVYCFENQTSLVASVMDGKAMIKELPLDDYYNYIIGETVEKMDEKNEECTDLEVIEEELYDDPFYSRENIEELERRVADIRTGKSKLTEHYLMGGIDEDG